MRRGIWHQFGDKSQKLALEQLQLGVGVGVIISVRDLSMTKAIEYSAKYLDLSAEVLCDLQFYEPGFSNKEMESYGLEKFRASISQLSKLTDQESVDLCRNLEQLHREMKASAIIAPAVLYETGRPDIVDINAKLFTIAKSVGDAIGIPTYATVGLGISATSTEKTVSDALSYATAHCSDGWYFLYEFPQERIPSNLEHVKRCVNAGLALAGTGKPLLHGYAGPLGLLSFACGAVGAGIGHSQNLWRFTRDRWQSTEGQGGGGDAPPRFFSRSLWGTIVYPDEVVQLETNLRQEVMTQSEFSKPTASSANLEWNRWEANKHFVNILGTALTEIAVNARATMCAELAIELLNKAVALHDKIVAHGIKLRDNSSAYQKNWKEALQAVLEERKGDYEYLDLVGV